MEASDQHPKLWSATQTYTMAVICLLLGLAVGYLLHSPGTANSSTPAAASSLRAVPTAANASAPSADDLKRMADKQVAPLLAELQTHPKEPELLIKIGRSYFAAQQFQTSVPYYERAVALKPNPDALNELSFAYYSLGNADKAIATLNRALKVDPKNPKVEFNLGMFEWHGKSDPKAAIAAWQDFLKDNPNDPKRAEVERLITQAKQHLNIPAGTRTDKPVM